MTFSVMGDTALPTQVASREATASNSNRLVIEIGGVSMGMWCERNMRMAIDKEHNAFLVESPKAGACEMELEIGWVENLVMPTVAPSFASGGLWSAYTGETGTKFYFSIPMLGSSPYKAAWFDPSFQRGHIVLRRDCFNAEEPVFPLEYPIDELAMMHRLALGEGVELHALGLQDQDGSGYLFLGHSGAGKSTTARLWMAEPGVKLLSDDRIILRRRDGQYWMYGTPWHGDAGVSSAACAPLSAIYLLEQARENEVLPLPAGRASAELFARCFVPHYAGDGLQFTLRFFDELTRSLPCSVFRFAPTENAVEAIRHVRA